MIKLMGKIRLPIVLTAIWFVLCFPIFIMGSWWTNMLGGGGIFLVFILTIFVANYWVKQGFKKYKGS